MGKKGKLKLKEKRMKKSILRKSMKKSPKSGLIKLSNLPFKITEEDVEKFLSGCGNIEYVVLHRKKNGKYNGTGTVKFSDLSSAQTAVEKCSGMNMNGRTITVDLTHKNSQDATNRGAESATQDLPLKEESCDEIEDIEMSERVKEENEDDNENKESEWPGRENSEGPVNSKFNSKIRVGRIIVRNVSFKITEEEFRKHFESFGTIVDAKLLKRDGKFVGCGFVQFENRRIADKAITETNGKKLLGRPIICDWAIPKDKYRKNLEEENSSKTPEVYVNGVVIKQEPSSDSETENDKSNIVYDSEVECVKEEESTSDKYCEKKVKRELTEEEARDGSGDDESNYSNSSDEDSKRNKKKEIFKEVKKPKVISNDVSEGRTIFVKDIPFSATKEDLHKCMKRFGPIYYAVVCVDEFTEHSKGTGFVKFKNTEDAQKCLEASAELTIDGESIQVVPAVPRDEIKSLHERKKERKIRDKRHLYLVKEGVILAGTPAAKGVSIADMDKRLSLERWKSQILKNLDMFVSNTRLVVYNIPTSWTDRKVFELFKEHGGKGAKVTEARIMRDTRNLDENGVGKSKEFAFVRFDQHEHALNALRSLNNNPDIFSVHKRPIVSFSIENKAIHKVKEKRLQKSRMANVKKQQQQQPKDSAKASSKGTEQSFHKPMRKGAFGQRRGQRNVVSTPAYSGIVSEPGNKNLKNKAIREMVSTHRQNVRKQNRKEKDKLRTIVRKKTEPMPKPRKKAREEEDSFSKLVNQYKATLGSYETQKKWYS